MHFWRIIIRKFLSLVNVAGQKKQMLSWFAFQEIKTKNILQGTNCQSWPLACLKSALFWYTSWPSGFRFRLLCFKECVSYLWLCREYIYALVLSIVSTISLQFWYSRKTKKRKSREWKKSYLFFLLGTSTIFEILIVYLSVRHWSYIGKLLFATYSHSSSSF